MSIMDQMHANNKCTNVMVSRLCGGLLTCMDDDLLVIRVFHDSHDHCILDRIHDTILCPFLFVF